MSEEEIKDLRKKLGIDEYIEWLNEKEINHFACRSFQLYMHLLEKELIKIKKQRKEASNRHYLKNKEIVNRKRAERQRKKVEDLRNKGCINAWAVVRGAKPKFKLEGNNE